MSDSRRVVFRMGVFAALMTIAWSTSMMRAQSATVPKYEVDSTWPKPLPNRWVIGGLSGVCVDANDHVLILNRQNVRAAELYAGRLAPPIIELDSAGNVVNSWGDPSLLDPGLPAPGPNGAGSERRLHSCHFDKNNDVWIASTPSGMVQKYSHDGSRLLTQIGKKGVYDSSDGTEKGQPLNSNAPRFFNPSDVYEDPQNGDVYVSDGEGMGGNRRVAVFDRGGNFLRQWQPEGPQRLVHCMSVSRDGLVYICDREGDRIQVYDKQGKFLRNIDIPWKPYIMPRKPAIALGATGAAVSLDLSRDRTQRLMYLINQDISEVAIIERETGVILSSFGRPGHFAGEFDNAHGIAVDSKANVYVTEYAGKRVQKFRPVS